MRRRFTLFLLGLVVGTTALASAQETPPDPVDESRLVAPIPAGAADSGSAPFGPLEGVWEPVELEAVEAPSAPARTQGHASDFCSTAAPLRLSQGTGGDQSLVNDMSSSPTDPVLSCMWGSPSSPRGYRTVWYQFEAPATGILELTTDFVPSDYSESYDTVLAIYRSQDGSCDDLAQLACNDDAHGLLSQTSAFVLEGERYYIEVADWSLGVQGAAQLNLSIVLFESDSLWTTLENVHVANEWLANPRTRHSVVTDGRYIYIIGGEYYDEDTGQPLRVGTTLRFDPRTLTWKRLAAMPGVSGFFGYSRTDAAYLNGHIYVPSGFVGDNNQFAATHRVYEVATDRWLVSTPAPWPGGQATAYSQIVAVPGNGSYYVIGGLTSGDGNPVGSFEEEVTDLFIRFTPDGSGGGSWTTQLPMSRARYAHVADLLQTPSGQEICVAGGIGVETNGDDDPVGAVLATVECYDIGDDRWHPIAPLNTGRFAAGSAVGPDGRWYVFGGVGLSQNGLLVPINETEVYDPQTDRWKVLDNRYDLEPPRAWPRGASVNSGLWAFGGETTPDHPQRTVIPLVEELSIMAGGYYMPLVSTADVFQIEPNDSFAQAHLLPNGFHFKQDFAGNDDFFDVYRFRVETPGFYEIRLTSIPSGHDYDLYVYNADKFWITQATRPGDQSEKIVQQFVSPGLYYVMVVRVLGPPTTDLYDIVVFRQ